jgi:hypothetical protein
MGSKQSVPEGERQSATGESLSLSFGVHAIQVRSRIRHVVAPLFRER